MSVAEEKKDNLRANKNYRPQRFAFTKNNIKLYLVHLEKNGN